jgi:hypothetical protein
VPEHSDRALAARLLSSAPEPQTRGCYFPPSILSFFCRLFPVSWLLNDSTGSTLGRYGLSTSGGRLVKGRSKVGAFCRWRDTFQLGVDQGGRLANYPLANTLHKDDAYHSLPRGVVITHAVKASTSSMPAMMRSLSSCFDATRI